MKKIRIEPSFSIIMHHIPSLFKLYVPWIYSFHYHEETFIKSPFSILILHPEWSNTLIKIDSNFTRLMNNNKSLSNIMSFNPFISIIRESENRQALCSQEEPNHFFFLFLGSEEPNQLNGKNMNKIVPPNSKKHIKAYPL